MPEQFNSIGGILRKWRTEKGLNQQQVAALTDIPQSTVSEYETGRRFPPFSYVSRLAAELTIDTDGDEFEQARAIIVDQLLTA